MKNKYNSLEEQLESEKECLDFIKLWFKGMIPATGVLWIISLLLLSKLNISFLLTPTILFTIGVTLSSMYMLIQATKFKHNIKCITHKLYIQEVTNQLNKKEHTKLNTNTKSHTNNKDYSYKSNNNYTNTQLNNHSLKNYKIKKRVLKSSNIYTTKKSD